MLKEIQVRILNSLMDNDENVEGIKEILNDFDKYIVDEKSTIEALLFLVENKYIIGIEPKYNQKEKKYYPYEVSNLDVNKMQDYWFRLLKKGRKEVNKKCYDQIFNYGL